MLETFKHWWQHIPEYSFSIVVYFVLSTFVIWASYKAFQYIYKPLQPYVALLAASALLAPVVFTQPLYLVPAWVNMLFGLFAKDYANFFIGFASIIGMFAILIIVYRLLVDLMPKRHGPKNTKDDKALQQMLNRS